MALLPQWRSSFDEALIEAIETVARDLERLRADKPAVFAYADPLLEHVVCTYSAAATSHEATFDADHRVLHISLPSWGPFVQRGTVFHALEQEYSAELDRRFASVEPEQAKDVDAYFDYMTSGRRWNSGRSEAESLEARGVNIWRIVRLAPRVARARAWLVSHDVVQYFVRVYEGTVTVPPGPGFRHAEAAWIAWLNANIDALDAATQLGLVRDLKVRKRQHVAEGEAQLAAAFPGFDYVGWVERITDRWIAGGHREGDLEKVAMQSLFEYALDSDASTKRLTDYLLAKKDAALTKGAMADAVAHAPYARMVLMWRAVERDPVVWQAATVAISDDLGRVHDKSLLVDEARRLWHEHATPADRGAILYLLTQIEAGVYERINWAEFPRSFGSRISAPELSSLLDRGWDSVWDSHQLWQALSSGWSRAAIIVPHLDAYFDQARSSGRMGQANDAVKRIVSKLCGEHAASDLATLHAYLQRRRDSHPSEEKDLETVLYDSSPGHCSSN